jgi:hypothetical protein
VRHAAPLLLCLIALAAAAGCGSTETATITAEHAAKPGTLAALLTRPGPDVALVPGTADYAPGEVRMSFLVIRGNGKPVYRPRASVWVAPALDAKPSVRAHATLENIGVPGESEPAVGDVTQIYVTRFPVEKPGKYYIVVEPNGAAIQGFRDFQVQAKPKAPNVGDRAIASRTPTIASTNGDLSALTTREPPDRALLTTSVAEALAAHEPFVVTFATPEFCMTRTCGPVVDVVDAVRKRFSGRGIRFIHVEVYEDNDPSKGVNRWMKEWRLPSEPWTFLVGSDGLIKARFEGSVSVGELATAVRAHLT